jgi:NADPH:quinone reductase-like Zn-dependent oxidoreductase
MSDFTKIILGCLGLSAVGTICIHLSKAHERALVTKVVSDSNLTEEQKLFALRSLGIEPDKAGLIKRVVNDIGEGVKKLTEEVKVE